MKKIKIYIVYSKPFELFVKDSFYIFFFFHLPRRKFGGNHKRLSRISLYKCFSCSGFRSSTVINICRIKIIHSGFHVFINHSAYMLMIDNPIFFRKSHKPETEFRHFAQINPHTFSPLISFDNTLRVRVIHYDLAYFRNIYNSRKRILDADHGSGNGSLHIGFFKCKIRIKHLAIYQF